MDTNINEVFPISSNILKIIEEEEKPVSIDKIIEKTGYERSIIIMTVKLFNGLGKEIFTKVQDRNFVFSLTPFSKKESIEILENDETPHMTYENLSIITKRVKEYIDINNSINTEELELDFKLIPEHAAIVSCRLIREEGMVCELFKNREEI